MTRPIWMLPRQALTGDVVRQVVADQVEEGQRLDFKRDAYSPSQKDEVRKDVVGMLNGGGGLILIGVSEESHRAARLAPVASAEDHARWIEQIVNTGVEPHPLGLETFVVATGDGGAAVAVRCVPGARMPYARTSEGRCRFFRRQGTEVLEMGLAEIRAAVRSSQRHEEQGATAWIDYLRRVRGDSMEPALVARVAPILVDVEILDPLDPELSRIVRCPERGQPHVMGNLRPLPAPYGPGAHALTLTLDGLLVQPQSPGEAPPPWMLNISRRGEVTLVARGLGVADMFDPPKDAPPKALNPTPICLYPVSVASVAENVFDHIGAPAPYAVSLALVRTDDVKLTTFVPYGGLPRLRGTTWGTSRDDDPVSAPQMQVASLSGEGPHPFFAPLQRLFNAFGFAVPPVEFFHADGTLDPGVLGGQ